LRVIKNDFELIFVLKNGFVLQGQKRKTGANPFHIILFISSSLCHSSDNLQSHLTGVSHDKQWKEQPYAPAAA
ncbi:hypothetical protein VIGAN_11001700, partial [Vigna angularis var. angularis]